MFTDFSVFHFLIYAAAIGFAAAIIYTNIQRTALSVFINKLIDSCCFAQDTAITLDEIGLSAMQKAVISSAVKHQYGLKKCVSVVKDTADKDGDLFFENKTQEKYFLSETNTEFLKKKYSFKTMPTKFVVLFIIALAVIVLATSSFVSWLISSVSMPKQETSDSDIANEELQSQKTSESDILNEQTDSNTLNNDSTIEESDGPRIPI